MKVKEDKVGLVGQISVRAFHAGESEPFVVRDFKPNTITNAGLAAVAKLIGEGLSEDKFDYIGIGTDDTAAAATDTALGTEIESRADCTVTNITTNETNDTAQFVGTVSITASRSIAEYGLFNASSGGDMLSRQVQSAINLESGDSIEITWKITVT